MLVYQRVPQIAILIGTIYDMVESWVSHFQTKISDFLTVNLLLKGNLVDIMLDIFQCGPTYF